MICNIRFRHVFLLTIAVMVVGQFISPAVVSGRGTGLARHHLDLRSGVPAFTFGWKPGLNPRPSGVVTIYGDGKVETTGRTNHRAVSRLPLSQLKSLMLQADTTGFFRLPLRIRAAEPMPDSAFAFITIHTATQDKTVTKAAGTRNATFDQLLAKLNGAVAVSH